MVTFRASDHTYTNEKGEQYISVTTFLGKYKKPFDVETHAARVADRTGVTVDAVKQMWKDNTTSAQDRGTSIHKTMENFLLYGDVNKDNLDLTDSYTRIIGDFNRGSTVKSEMLLWNDDAKIAGTADVVIFKGDSFAVLDFKTNKQFNLHSKYGEKLLYPLDYLDSCEYNVYTLQLSLYAYMIEEMTGKTCRFLKLLYLRDNLVDSTVPSRFWREIPIFYSRSTIMDLIKSHTKTK